MATSSGTPSKEAAQNRRVGVSLALDRAIHAYVADVDPDAFEVREPRPGAEECWGKRKQPLALPAIAAVRVVLTEAIKAEREAIAHARGQGHTWTQIGHALGEAFVQAAKREDMALAEAAWRYAVWRIMPDKEIPFTWNGGQYAARWRCWTCSKDILEGPAEDGPEAERGHAPGCARLAKRRRQGYRWT